MGYPIYSVMYSGVSMHQAGGVNLNDIVSIDTKNALATTVGTCDFQVQNIDNDYTGSFYIDDSVSVYMGYNNRGSALVFSGFVNQMSDQNDMKERNMKISAVDKMERLLSQLDAKDYPVGVGPQTASAILADPTLGIIQRINGFRKAGEPLITTNHVTTTTLPITPYGYNYRPVMEILRELAGGDKTGMGQFLYYIDINNDLHFGPRPGTSTMAFVPSVHEYNFTSFRAEYSIFDVVNAVIVNCGMDDNNNAVLALGVNYTSVTSVGFRWKYIVKTELGDAYRNKGMSIADQRNAMKNDGIAWANSYTLTLGEPRWRITASMKGHYNYPNTSIQMILGEIVKITSPSNWNGVKVLRLTDINQNFTIGGWTTELQFEEDDKTKLEPTT